MDGVIRRLNANLARLVELCEAPELAEPIRQTLRETLQSLDTEAEIAIQNANLHQDSAKRVDELIALQKIAKAITSAVDLQQNLHRIAESAVSLVGGDAFSSSVYLYDPEKDEFREGAAAGEIDLAFLGQHRPRRDGLGRKALRTGKPVFASDINLINPTMVDFGVRAVVCFPLIGEVGTVGLLYVHFRTRHGDALAEHESRVLATFADQAAVAIRKDQLFEQMQEAMALLHEIGMKLQSALSVQDVLKSIVEGAMRVTGTEAGVIYLVSEEGVLTQPVAVPPGFAHPVPRIASRKGLTYQIMNSGEPIVIADATQDPRVNPALVEKGVRSLVGFPLRLEDKAIGVLYVNDFCIRRFSERELSLVSFLASQIVAIRRAQVYEERLRQLAEAQQREIEQRRAAEMGSIGAAFAHRMGNLGGLIPDTVRELRKRIGGQDEYLLANLGLLERGAEQLMKMAESLDRLGALGPATLVEMNSVLEAALEHSDVPDRIEVSRDLASDLPMIRADRSFLVEVFVNLIENAVEAMPDGGRLRVSSRVAEGAWVEGKVSDTGRGIPPNVVSGDLFMPFFTTKDQGGMGIGLWSSRDVIRLVGGDILVESTEGKGSVFTVRLPAAREGGQV